MRLYAFAAFLALPFLGLWGQTAKADNYCCGGEANPYHSVIRDFYVYKDAVVFGCDGYHCETNIKLLSDVHIKAKCRNGWCEVRSFPFKDAWVLESCLKRVHDGRGGYPDYYSGHVKHKPYDADHNDGPGYGRRY